MDFDKIIYFHVPKAAGTSLANAFSLKYGAENVKSPATKFDYLQTPPIYLSKHKVLAGHITHDTALPYITNKSLLITVFRDPKKRIRSIYNYFYNLNDGSVHNIFARKYNFYDWLMCNEPAVLIQIENSVIRQFTPESYWQIDCSAAPEIILHYSKMFIDRFNIVGFIDQLDTFSNELFKASGVKLDQSRFDNASIEDRTLNVDDFLLGGWLEKRAWLELEFYKYVHDKFHL